MNLSALLWRNWNLRSRLLLIILLPVIYMFCSMVWYTYHSRLEEGKGELAERAYVVSTALAESVEYNLLTRNLAGLKSTMTDVMLSDRSIYRIDVLDADRTHVLHVISSEKALSTERFVEVPVRRQLVWVNLLNDAQNVRADGLALDAGKADGKNAAKNASVLGYVRVTMTATRMLARHSQRFMFELAISALALFVSAVLAVYLSLSLTHPLQMAIETLREIREGDYSSTLEVTTGGEIGDLQTSINAMSVSLQQAKQDLENKVQERTQDLMASRNEALKANAEKRKLIQKVHSIVEDERKSIAIEIHDELNASLIAARLEAQRIQHLAAQIETSEVNGEAAGEIQERAKAITKMTLDLYANGRNLVRRLRPEVLDMLGLQGAVEDMLRHYNSNAQGCQFHFDSEGDFSGLDSGLAISVYRIIQEALSNVMKHAQATQVEVALTMLEAQHSLQIEVSDNGQGFDIHHSSAGIGITGMRERVAAFHGEIDLQSSAEEGTQLIIRFPVATT
ncbi:ATP-binding protein [Undibacterium umbellatum]|uniref:histidine kinase n=1 Tax=Undibacterium umbellatum TaxID=2762300 RepID=A0ABR6ZEG2_9BURK|nr:ATP-binding protein [Undibacterium umbellatum]MBC3910131.1 HAMP domain-containing protein [Undibacterium umbellatum]